MSDEDIDQPTDEAPETEAKAPKAKKPKPKPKKPVPKAKKTTAKPKRESNPPRDNARKVARASAGKLTTDQVRILRTLNGKGRPSTMDDIKKGCGIDEEKKYSGSFLKGLHELQEERLIRVDKEQEVRSHSYAITDKGTSALKKAEAALKAAA